MSLVRKYGGGAEQSGGVPSARGRQALSRERRAVEQGPWMRRKLVFAENLALAAGADPFRKDDVVSPADR